MEEFETYKEMFNGYDTVERELGHFPAFIDSVISGIKVNNREISLDFALFAEEYIATIELKNAEIATLKVATANPNMDANYIYNIAVTTEKERLVLVLYGFEAEEIFKAYFTDASIHITADTERKTRRFINAVFHNLPKLD